MIILQNIWRRVVGYVLINISPWNILPIMHQPERFHQNGLAGFGLVSINGLRVPFVPFVYNAKRPLRCKGYLGFLFVPNTLWKDL